MRRALDAELTMGFLSTGHQPVHPLNIPRLQKVPSSNTVWTFNVLRLRRFNTIIPTIPCIVVSATS
jgi:hypothetical protein